jgi:hypothetical protein
VPPPTPFVPDVPTFLTLIGRQLSVHASKIPSWNALFTLTSAQLRELGVEPARSRRYLLWWREKFRQGEFGIGGDLKVVKDGVAEVRVKEIAAVDKLGKPKVVRLAVNGPGEWTGRFEDPAERLEPEEVKVKGVKVVGGGMGLVQGSGFSPVKGTKGSVARIAVKEGLWEVKRGVKVHGGERRRKNVLSRIAAKERGTLK